MGARRLWPTRSSCSRGPRFAWHAAFALVGGAGLALALFAWTGCEVLVDGKLDDVHCDVEGTVGPPACPVGSACKDGLCSPLELGLPCTADADCWPGDLCFDPVAFGGVGPKTCSRPCCTSNDCDPDASFVCWVRPAGGGSFCRPGADLGRAAIGSLRTFEPCALDGDCRSGVCDASMHRCADTCCTDTSCAGVAGACRFASQAPAGDGPGFFCAEPSHEGAGRYAPCAKDSDCASGLCVLQMGSMRCSVPCCSSSMCETGPDKGEPVRCMTMQHEGGTVRACGDELPYTATRLVGAECGMDDDCRSGACVDGRCTDACCTDASCGDEASFGCRPMLVSSSWALRCAPK